MASKPKRIIRHNNIGELETFLKSRTRGSIVERRSYHITRDGKLTWRSGKLSQEAPISGSLVKLTDDSISRRMELIHVPIPSKGGNQVSAEEMDRIEKNVAQFAKERGIRRRLIFLRADSKK